MFFGEIGCDPPSCAFITASRAERPVDFILGDERGHRRQFRQSGREGAHGKIQFLHAGQQFSRTVIAEPEQIPVFRIVRDERPEVLLKTGTKLRLGDAVRDSVPSRICRIPLHIRKGGQITIPRILAEVLPQEPDTFRNLPPLCSQRLFKLHVRGEGPGCEHGVDPLRRLVP